VIRIPDGSPEPPASVVDFAARLAAWHSKARGAGGKVEVHLCRAGEVRKPRGYEPGKVQLKSYSVVKVMIYQLWLLLLPYQLWLLPLLSRQRQN